MLGLGLGEGGIGDLGPRRLGAAVLVVGVVSVVASASVLGLLTAPGSFVGACRGRHCPFARTFVRGINLVVTTLAAVLHTPLHQGAARGWRQSVRLAHLGQRSAINIPKCMVTSGTAHGRRMARPFTRNACR